MIHLYKSLSSCNSQYGLCSGQTHKWIEDMDSGRLHWKISRPVACHKSPVHWCHVQCSSWSSAASQAANNSAVSGWWSWNWASALELSHLAKWFHQLMGMGCADYSVFCSRGNHSSIINVWISCTEFKLKEVECILLHLASLCTVSGIILHIRCVLTEVHKGCTSLSCWKY